MASSVVQRKLTVIHIVDMKSYRRLMGDDPKGTLQTLTDYREVFSSCIQQFQSRLVDAPPMGPS